MTRIYFHGNCQTRALQRILIEEDNCIQVSGREIQTIKIPSEMPAYCKDITTADVIISQPISNSYRGEPRLSTKWVLENKRSEAKLIVFPSLFFRAYTPQIFYLRPFDAVGMPYHDVHYATGYVNGRRPDDIFAETTDSDFLPDNLVQRDVAAAIESLQKREIEMCNVVVSDLIQENYRNQLLFHTPNHPSRFLLELLLERILVAAGLTAKVGKAGRDYLADLSIPPYPSVRLFLNLISTPEFADMDGFTKFRLPRRLPVPRLDYLNELWVQYDKLGGKEIIGGRLREEAGAVSYLQRAANSRKE